MSDRIPFFLREAVITLYPAAPDGSALTGAPVWTGALASRFRAVLEYDEVKLMASGDRYATVNHVDEQTIITIGKTWILRKSVLTDFKPVRNQQYVMQAVWSADGYWFARTFYGVTGRSINLDAPTTSQFLTDQVFRAQYFQDAGGPGQPPVTVPVVPPGSVSEPFGFFREDPFVNGEYLLGTYSFAQAVSLGLVEFTGLAPLSSTVLTLEVNGILTGNTLVIPGGTANTVVNATVDLGGYGVAAGQNIRWQITSGPAPEDAAWQAALMMQVSNS